MNHLLDHTDEEEQIRHRTSSAHHREITLGTTMILLIFFALAVYGAALFGFGYSMGSKHSAGNGPAVTAAATGGMYSGGKPSPGSAYGTATEKSSPVTDTTPVPYTQPPVTKTVSLPEASASPSTPTAEPELPPVAKAVPLPPAPSAPPTVSSAPVAIAPGGVSLVVQVAAVSHQEDADMMAAALKRRGYVVNVRGEPDKLIHVQVGPFASRKDAEAMRTRLLADGFNAYIKQ